MSSIQNPLTTAQYQVNILQALANTGITQFAAGGKARAFGDIVASELGKMETREFLNLGQTVLPFATGQNLDLIGDIFGVNRLSAQPAMVQSSDSNFTWYVNRGTFGDLNSGQDILVPAGVQISSVSGTPMFLADAVTLPAGASSQSFSASSITPGSGGDAQSNTLTSHNFSGYSLSSFAGLLVTNNYGVVGGTDDETDENFRARINLKLQSPSGANDAALRFNILRVPGVQDVVFETRSGLVYVYVYSVVPQPAASLLSNVQQIVDNTIAYPGIGTAVAPDLVGISLSTTLTLQKNLSQGDRINVIEAASAAVQKYINNLGIGKPIVVNEIGVQIFQSDSRILDVGQPNNEIPELLIWRSRSDGTRYSRYLLGNYQPQAGERLVVETNTQVTTPINLTVVG
jgi:uncharacterized phage protein gp47/JayE